MKPGYFDRYRQRKAIKKLARFNDEAEDFVKLGEEMASIEKGIKERGLENSEISMNPGRKNNEGKQNGPFEKN